MSDKNIEATAAFFSMRLATFVIFISCLLVGQISCEQRDIDFLTSGARGVVSSVNAKADSLLVNGGFDYSIVIDCTVKNVGKYGVIRVTPWLSSSEGEWSLDQHLYFQEGETKNLKFTFSQPTINATNLQYGVKIFPEPSSSR